MFMIVLYFFMFASPFLFNQRPPIVLSCPDRQPAGNGTMSTSGLASLRFHRSKTTKLMDSILVRYTPLLLFIFS